MDNVDQGAATLQRRDLLAGAGAAVVLGVAGGYGGVAQAAEPVSVVYVGTYTAPHKAPGSTVPSKALGISAFVMDKATGRLSPLQTVPTENPSYLALHPQLPVLYACNETQAGAVSAFAIGADGKLTLLNTRPADGAWTTHIHVYPSGRYLVASNYGDGTTTPGNVPVFALNADGSIGARTADFKGVANGTGPDAARQEAPHAHQTISDPAGLHLFNVDLGADKVNILNLGSSGALTANEVPFAHTAAGSGPRHMAFHPNRKVAYVLKELVAGIDVFDYAETRGALVWKQSVSTLPAGFTGIKAGAEIRVTPDGRFLYATNRGHNSVAAFRIAADGRLTLIDTYPSGGAWPRGMAIDPGGTFLYVMNQNADGSAANQGIVVYRIGADGVLTHTGITVDTPTPVDMVFGR